LFHNNNFQKKRQAFRSFYLLLSGKGRGNTKNLPVNAGNGSPQHYVAVSSGSNHTGEYSNSQNKRKNMEVDSVFEIQAGSAEAGFRRYLESSPMAKKVAIDVIEAKNALSLEKATTMKASGNLTFSNLRLMKANKIVMPSIAKIMEIEKSKEIPLAYDLLTFEGKPKLGEKSIKDDKVEVHKIFFWLSLVFVFV